MKRHLIYSTLALFLFLGVGLNIATAVSIDLVGVWVGTASIATDTGFSNGNMTLEILAQQDVGFSGTMQFGNGIPFKVNGVVDNRIIVITGSASHFGGFVSGKGAKGNIHGSGSRFETDAFPSASVVFDLHRE